jgi:U3 small nucleolar RNA-associated protein 21
VSNNIIVIFRFKDVSELRQSLATCLCLSMCGNFVIIGYDSGHVDKYNIQSGIHRGSLSQAEQGGPAYLGSPVRGIVSDGLNQVYLAP